MADDLDRADEQIERMTAASVANSSNNTVMVDRIGACHNCGHVFPDGDQRVYCDSECADDHALFLKMKGR